MKTKRCFEFFNAKKRMIENYVQFTEIALHKLKYSTNKFSKLSSFFLILLVTNIKSYKYLN